ncbi:MarR family winged helix-turn-helix transcriptional regulator [Conexibacter arvalis]|uniref:DNA-binding MarR family transcriptional regulator n=1 Tax=Conexibacter arvalis TaxID=912552 RepID=A0A840IGL4_9ACTN|nr:MarR family transcriptional regulator [Conexibacter arvalis]MBB4663916.1 DNA-binding MarR family transcriptional regulator [Conexibacter arvalis]
MNDLHDLGRRTAALDKVIELSVLLNDDMDRDLARRNLTRSRVHVVWLISQHGPMTQRDLAAVIGVSARNVTGLVDGLERTGFVRREPHPSDRRALLVTLTPHGEETAADLQRGYVELAGQLFGSLPPRRLDELTKGLDHVLAELRRAIAEAESG